MGVLDFPLLRWQREVFSDPTRFKVVVAGRRCGKTRASAVTLIVRALECTHKDATILYVAPTYGMAKTLMWDLLMDLAQPVIKKSNVNDGELTVANGVKIRIRGADNPDSLRGMKLHYCVIDEMKDIKATVWELIIRPALSDLRGGALLIGTPEPGTSLFRDYFDLGETGEDDEWKSWHFTTLDNELIDPKEIAAAKRSMSTMAFRQEYMADFDTMASDIFKEEWFKYGPEPREGDYFIAVDLAGFEDVSDINKKKYLDDTAIAVVKITPEGKWWVKKVDSFRKDVRETAVRILLAIRTYKPICIGIEKGSLMRALMPYLTDLMNKNGVYAHIEAISTSGSSKKGSDAIANRVIFALQGLFEHGRITFSDSEDHDKLKHQLMMFPSPKTHDDMADALSLIAHLHTVIYGEQQEHDEYEVLDVISGY
jgi:phage terminase large subunit-like protein